MCWRGLAATTKLRELRHQASELVRQAEAGETITVTVSGRSRTMSPMLMAVF
ncbi:type II toxin-antitoxin system Phd/YefM family antitoxin [Jatrophihabitans lederbergiae]|uniref:type II toxin-antitoxin system Phd/YefM family antitoxin n=1 Tax=Jatrophihabitans lederbergiae TaxID=3075547 RepID=UPI0037C18AEA